jgi:hypothetical protein
MPTLTRRRSVERRQQKITLAEMRAAGVRGLLVYCADYRCSHSIAISGDKWPDHVRLSDLEPQFVCKTCGQRGADVRPDFDWNKPWANVMGYRQCASTKPITTAPRAQG